MITLRVKLNWVIVMLNFIEIGMRIRAKREEVHWSRDTLAEKLDITPKFCSDIELGVKGFSLKTLCRLSEVLGVTTDYILFGSNETDYDNIIRMLNKCNDHQLKQIEKLIQVFLETE